MALITVAGVKPYYGSVAGITAAALIFDGTGGAGTNVDGARQSWEVSITNADTTVTNILYIGFDTSVDATLGYGIPGAFAEKKFLVPPGTLIYAFASSSRDARIVAVPRFTS